jgi:hypothetical protein
MNCRGYFFTSGWVRTRACSVKLEELLGIPVGCSQVLSHFEERHGMFILSSNVSHHCYSGKNYCFRVSVSGRKKERSGLYNDAV